MESQEHLNSPEITSEMIGSVSKLYSILSEEEREFLFAARVALESRVHWS
jgi:hypothetical protein